MKLLILTIGISFLISCGSNNTKKQNEQKQQNAKLELIFGKEKTELEEYKLKLDSLINESHLLALDTNKIISDKTISYFMLDSIDEGDFSKLISVKEDDPRIPYNMFNQILVGEIKYSEYTSIIKSLKSVKYILYTKKLIYVEPKIVDKSTFNSGVAICTNYFIDINSKKIIATDIFRAKSSNEVETKLSELLSSIDLDNDFKNNYRSEKEKSVQKIIGKLYNRQ
jgi:hypothetical protein